MCKHKINKRNRLKQRLKVEKKENNIKEYLKEKAPRIDFLPLPSVKSIIIQ